MKYKSEGETLKRTNTREHESTVVGHGNVGKGWHKHSKEHALAAHGVQTALNKSAKRRRQSVPPPPPKPSGSRKVTTRYVKDPATGERKKQILTKDGDWIDRPIVKGDKYDFGYGLQGEDWESSTGTAPPDEAVEIYVDELNNMMNKQNELYDKGEITEEELDARQEIIRLTVNHFREENLNTDEMASVYRQALEAIDDDSRRLFFYYNIGKEWRDPDTFYQYENKVNLWENY